MRVPAPPDEYATAAELDQVRQAVVARNQDTLDEIRFWDAGSPAYRWMQASAQEIINRNVGPTLATRAMALVAVAMYDATLAAWDSKYFYNRPRPSELDPDIPVALAVPRSPGYPSEYAATAGAAAAVLSYLFPDAAGRFQDMAGRAAGSRVSAGLEFPTDSQAGALLGQAVAQKVIAYGKADGSDAQFVQSFPPMPGVWSSASPVTPLAGSWKPWVLSAGNQFRPDPPPAAGTPEMAAQVAAVENLNRTTAVVRTAWVWQQSFITPWLDTIYQELFNYHLDGNAPRAARAFALAMVAQHDATLACWDAKYAYLEMRPSMLDPAFTPLFPNPQHPGYPSGHACASGGIAAVLGALFPADAQSFSDKANEAGTSTFDAGIHSRLDVDTGLSLGRAVGQAVAARAAQDGAQQNCSETDVTSGRPAAPTALR
jgi:hypothetical protein